MKPIHKNLCGKCNEDYSFDCCVCHLNCSDCLKGIKVETTEHEKKICISCFNKIEIFGVTETEYVLNLQSSMTREEFVVFIENNKYILNYVKFANSEIRLEV